MIYLRNGKKSRLSKKKDDDEYERGRGGEEEKGKNRNDSRKTQKLHVKLMKLTIQYTRKEIFNKENCAISRIKTYRRNERESSFYSFVAHLMSNASSYVSDCLVSSLSLPVLLITRCKCRREDPIFNLICNFSFHYRKKKLSMKYFNKTLQNC